MKDKTYLIKILKPIPFPDNAILINKDGTYQTVAEYKKNIKYPKDDFQ